MKTKLLLFFLIFSFSAMVLKAQQFKAVPQKVKTSYNYKSAAKTEAACDTANLAESENWTPTVYTLETDGDPETLDGFIFGTMLPLNISGLPTNIKKHANYFDLSGSDYHYITGARIDFGYANPNPESDADEILTFSVLIDSDGDGLPDDQIGDPFYKTFGEIKQNVDSNESTIITFPNIIALPENQQFYISVDMSTLKWQTDSTGRQDSIAIICAQDDEAPATAYQFLKPALIPAFWTASADLWVSGEDQDPLNTSLYIFPFVSATESGCGLLPVTFLSFNGVIQNNQALLNWSTATENNNKGFYVERSADGRNFSSIAFVNGHGTSTQVNKYSYTDIDLAKLSSSSAYYRLKQVDFDGRVKYSGVVKLDLNKLFSWNIYPNPVESEAWAQLQLSNASKISLQVINASGKIVQSIDKGMLSAGSYSIPLGLSRTTKGTYYIRLKVNDDTFVKTILK